MISPTRQPQKAFCGIYRGIISYFFLCYCARLPNILNLFPYTNFIKFRGYSVLHPVLRDLSSYLMN